jgi:hypothetical protein
LWKSRESVPIVAQRLLIRGVTSSASGVVGKLDWRMLTTSRSKKVEQTG